jgi:hypothetical protein
MSIWDSETGMRIGSPVFIGPCTHFVESCLGWDVSSNAKESIVVKMWTGQYIPTDGEIFAVAGREPKIYLLNNDYQPVHHLEVRLGGDEQRRCFIMCLCFVSFVTYKIL